MVNLTNGVRLPDLDMPEFIALADEAWRYRHEAGAQTVQSSALKPEDRVRTLDQLDQLRGTDALLFWYAYTYAGSYSIVRKAAAKANIAETELKGIRPDEFREAAKKLVCVPVSNAEPVATDDDDPTKAPAS